MRRIAGLDFSALETAFQPIVDLRDGSTAGYEALMRGPEHSPLARRTSCSPPPARRTGSPTWTWPAATPPSARRTGTA